MKLLAVAATLIAMSSVHPAEACEPAPTCGDEFCRGVTTVVEGTLTATHSPDVEGHSTATIDLTAVYGDGTGLTVGSSTTIGTGQFYPFREGDTGKSLVLGLIRDANGTLQIELRSEVGDFYVAECFGADATAATMADVMLSPSCDATLDPNPTANPCENRMYCDAGGGRGSLWVLAAFGLVIRRRPRRDSSRRRAD